MKQIFRLGIVFFFFNFLLTSIVFADEKDLFLKADIDKYLNSVAVFDSTNQESDLLDAFKKLAHLIHEPEVDFGFVDKEFEWVAHLLHEKEGFIRAKSNFELLKGIVAFYSGDKEAISEHLQIVLDNYADQLPPYELARVYAILGNHYSKNDLIDEAGMHLLHAAKLYDTYDDSVTDFLVIEKWQFFNSIGLFYGSTGNIEMAEEHFLKALITAKFLESQFYSGLIKGNLGNLYYKQGDYAKAIPLLEEDFKMSLEHNEIESAVNALITLAEIKTKLNSFEETEAFILNGLERLNVDIYPYRIGIIYAFLSTLYENEKLYEKSAFYLKKQLAVANHENDFMKSLQRNRSITKFKAGYSENKLNVLRAESKLKERTFFYGILLFIIAIVVLFVFQIKNKKLRQNQKIIEKQHRELRFSNATKDKLFSIIAHDLRSPFASLQMLFNVIEDDDFNAEELKNLLLDMKVTVEGTASTLDNLLKWAKMQMDEGMKKKEALINLSEIAHRMIDFFKTQAQLKQVSIKNEISKKASLYADEDQIELIFRNLIGNALKFSNNGGSIIVSCKELESDFEISVADNGVGMSAAQLNRVFSNNKHLNSTRGTEGEKGTGLGLILCKEMIEYHGGKIWVESEEGSGTVFTFTIPAKKSA